MGGGFLSPRGIPAELVARYECRAPRYTSYPTAPHFRGDCDRTELERRWRQAGSGPMALYLHLPFCTSRCRYCGCHTFVGTTSKLRRAYVDKLLRDATWVAELVPGREAAQLALGGGTPNALEPELMARLVAGLDSRFRWVPGSERAIEIDPRTVDEGYLKLLVELGFNRFSFGVQDLDSRVQELIGRRLPTQRLAELLGVLRSRNLEAINFDLIYGLPGQTPESFRETLDRVVALGPSRIALFGYAHVPWVSPHQRALEEHGLPDSGQRVELWGLAFERLVGAGWQPVGMDHFARPGDLLLQALAERRLTRSFMGYTTGRGWDLVALGASAISSVNGSYVQNSKGLDEWLAAPGTQGWDRGLALSREERLRREVILDLFCNFHLDKRQVEREWAIDFERHFGREMERLELLAADGLLTDSPDEIAVTPLGRFFVRNIAMVFDQYLEQEGGDGAGRYSKTV